MSLPPLRLDYQLPVAAPRRWLGWAVLAAGAAVAGATVNGVVAVNQEASALEFRLARLERKPGPAARGAVAAVGSRDLAQRIKFADSVVERLNFPWDGLLRAVESAGGSRVALLSLEPDARRRTVRITAEAKNKKAMLDYVSRLGGSAQLAEVHLLDHETQQQEAGQPVRFSMEASWLEARRETR